MRMRPLPHQASRAVDTIPAQIVKAIATVQSSVEAVAKSQRNQHGNYAFASTDDIYAALTRKMGTVGLVCIALEDESEVKRLENKKGETVQWLRVIFSFVLATPEATWSDRRARRTLFVQITGPQSFQAAQSYAEKSFLRSLFKLPTGDMDLDSMLQHDTEDGQLAHAGNGVKRKSSGAAKKDGTTEVFNEIRTHISRCITADDLHVLRDTYAQEWAELPARWMDLLTAEYDDKMNSLLALEAAE